MATSFDTENLIKKPKTDKTASSRLQAIKTYCCFGCCTGKKLTVANGILVARAVIGGIIAIHILITFILLGANMDAANFPGSNMKFAEYQKDDNTNNLTYDPDREGDTVRVLDGYVIAENPGCTNFVTTLPTDVCKAATDQATDNAVDDWNNGWAVVQDCERSSTNFAECAPFGAGNGLSVIGQITFFALAVQTVLFCAHTCVAIYEQEKDFRKKASKEEIKLFEQAQTKTKITLGLCIVWCIIGFSLFLASAEAWEAFCDKIDTGLGRHVESKRACATWMCTYSFGQLFSTITFAIVWYSIPHLLTYCGVLEAV